MSRGPGRRQRAILEALESGNPVALTHPDDSTSDQVATRRAAYALEAQGKIGLVSQRVYGTPRLVAYWPQDAPVSQYEGTTTASGHPWSDKIGGLDGKQYRRTIG